MTLNQLIRITSPYYDIDDSVARSWDFGHRCVSEEGVGDTLALFIVREIADTFDESADDRHQLETASEAISSAADQLNRLANELWDHDDPMACVN